MSGMTSLITGVSIVYSTVYSGADQRKHESSVSLAFVRGIHQWLHQWLVNSLHKVPVMHKMFPFDDVIITTPLAESMIIQFSDAYMGHQVLLY